jgi:hypothetical protein
MTRLDTQVPRTETTEIRIAGTTLYVPSAKVCGWTVVVTGKWPRVAALKDEELVEWDPVQDAPRLIEALRYTQLRAEIFSFAQKLYDVTPRQNYHFELESWAAIPITSFEEWWKGLPQESRKNVRRSGKRGVVIKVAPFDDELVKAIQGIYNETPIRQGRPFWHFEQDFAVVKRAMGTYLDRSEFIGAYLNNELIGFIKVTYVDRVASIMQILAKNAHHEARPVNALLASTVELCQKREMSYLVYGQYVYGRHETSLLTEFKRRNGFEEVRLPRYFVPLTTRGWIAIRLRLHSRLRDRLPAPVISVLLRIRSWFHRLLVRIGR